MKECSKCHEKLSLDDFYENKQTRDHRASWCKFCYQELAKSYRSREDIKQKGQREEIKKYQKEYRQKNKTRIAENMKAYFEAHKEERKAYCSEWREKNTETLRFKKAIYHHANKDRYRQKKRKLECQRMKNDPMFKLHKAFSHRIRQALKQRKSRKHWEDIVGYAIVDLRQHLEKQFKPGMTWENYGDWHIDHKIPVKVFNFKSPEDIDFKKCWSLSNLQPLWGRDNLRKNAKLERPFQPAFSFSSVEEIKARMAM